MIDLKAIVDFISHRSAELQSRIQPPDWWPGAMTLAASAVVVGLVLALWGNRLLRLLYVLAFIGAGGAAGVQAARAANVDPLIGLLLGAGISGLVGHLLFRWWVGVTAACCAALVVMSTAGVRNMPDVEAAFEAFQKERGAAVVTRAVEAVPAEASSQQTPSLREAVTAAKAYAKEAFDYFYDRQRDLVYRVVVVAILAWITGLGMGLCLPRFTTIVGTSCVGVILIVLGAGMLAARYSPGMLETAESHTTWTLGLIGTMVLGSLMIQSRRKRAVAAPPSPPAAAPKAA